jgi:hypothetical protein
MSSRPLGEQPLDQGAEPIASTRAHTMNPASTRTDLSDPMRELRVAKCQLQTFGMPPIECR